MICSEQSSFEKYLSNNLIFFCNICNTSESQTDQPVNNVKLIKARHSNAMNDKLSGVI